MRRDGRAYLWDAIRAAEAIADFTRGKSYEEFAQDLLLRSAVERQFEIIGEALSQLARGNPAIAEKIPDIRRIIAFRNILVHGYAAIDREMVWRVVQENLPQLTAVLSTLLGTDAGPDQTDG
jgi:uncharacterized protein with HEPN domain